MENTPASSLYNLLVTRDFDPKIWDSANNPLKDPAKATMFSFDYITDNQNYGTVVILLGEDNNLIVFYGDNIGRSMEKNDRQSWYNFLEQLKNFSIRNKLSFELDDISKLKYNLQGMAAITEGLFESFYGKKRVSYSDKPKHVRLVIEHNKDIQEGEMRHRAIDKIFVETAEGERFLVPTRSLMHGRLLAQHIREGGTPYDSFGLHINELISEMGTLAKFIRAVKNKEYNDDAHELVEVAVRHYQDLKTKAKKMLSHRGYIVSRDQFDPVEIPESMPVTDTIRDMFITRQIDTRIEEALPILYKLKDNSSQEIDEFDEWATQMSEGTRTLPTSQDEKMKLQALMSKELLAGIDGLNATEQLYELIDDDQLFNILEKLGDQNPAANIWEDPSVKERLSQLGIDVQQDQPTVEDLDTDGVMMTRPSNMSSESADLRRLKELILI
jgi:hypothetical protein